MRINALQQATLAIRGYESEVENPTEVEAGLANSLIRLRIECLQVFGVLAQCMLDPVIGARVREIAEQHKKLHEDVAQGIDTL